MARYGSGYNTSITQALANVELSITTALVKAWDLFCDRLQDEIDQMWEDWIMGVYTYEPNYYYRTHQLSGSDGCPFKVVNKSNGVGVITNGNGTVVAGFDIDSMESIGIDEIDNPPYHVLDQGGDTEDFVNVVGATNPKVISFVDDLKQYLNDGKWKLIYREYVEALTNGKGIKIK